MNNENIALPLTFRLCQHIRFNRPVDKDRDTVSPGGYELEMCKETGETVSVKFDFETFEANIDGNDRTVVACEQKNPDTDCYGGLLEVDGYMLRHVTACKEWFIHTETEQETELVPVEIIDPAFVLISDGDGRDLGWERIPIGIPIEVSAD